MYLRSRTLFAIAMALLIGSASAETYAGERNYGRQVNTGLHHHIRKIGGRTNIRIVNRNVIFNIADGRHRQRAHRQINTYSGDVDVYYRRGVGSWSYGSVGAPMNVDFVQPSAKIISLSRGRNNCSIEHGVCVIRP